MVTQVSITLLCHIQWNLSFGTPPFKGQLYSGDAKFGPGKIFTTCLYLLLLLKGLPLFRGKGHFFWEKQRNSTILTDPNPNQSILLQTVGNLTQMRPGWPGIRLLCRNAGQRHKQKDCIIHSFSICTMFMAYCFYLHCSVVAFESF